MKKLIAIILIIALAVPALALADDPIVGNWYMLLDVKGSIFESSLPDYTQMVLILTFEENGNIIWSEHDYKGETIETNEPAVYGEWKNDGLKYTVSIVSVGTDEAFFEDDLLYVAAFSKGLYFGFRKMTNIDVYNNIYRK